MLISMHPILINLSSNCLICRKGGIISKADSWIDQEAQDCGDTSREFRNEHSKTQYSDWSDRGWVDPWKNENQTCVRWCWWNL